MTINYGKEWKEKEEQRIEKYGKMMEIQEKEKIENESKWEIKKKNNYLNLSAGLIGILLMALMTQCPQGGYSQSKSKKYAPRQNSLDSLYQVKTDSLKRAFENKLEKEIQ